MPSAEADLLFSLLERRLAPDAAAWLATTRAALVSDPQERDWLRAFSLAPRRLGKGALAPDVDALAAAAALRPGWHPSAWSIEQAGRIVVLLAPGWEGETFAAALTRIRATADLGEMITLALALPLLPAPALHVAWALECVRSSIRPLFEAVALANPFPAERFDERAWNQMILKALFVGSPLAPVEGFARRRNANLARMAEDYARERIAAGRPVPDDLALCLDLLAIPDAEPPLPPAAGPVVLQEPRPR